MKKTLVAFFLLLVAAPLSAQMINWDLSPVNSSLQTLIPNLLAIFCCVAIVGWEMWNLVHNWKDRAEIFTELIWSLLIVAIVYGIVYTAINLL